MSQGLTWGYSCVELDAAEAALVLASLDPLAGMVVTDPDKLRDLLAEVTVTDDELAAMPKALVPGPLGKTDPDVVPPLPTEPYVKAGELWLLGEHRLLVDDVLGPPPRLRVVGGGDA